MLIWFKPHKTNSIFCKVEKINISIVLNFYQEFRKYDIQCTAYHVINIFDLLIFTFTANFPHDFESCGAASKIVSLIYFSCTTQDFIHIWGKILNNISVVCKCFLLFCFYFFYRLYHMIFLLNVHTFNFTTQSS